MRRVLIPFGFLLITIILSSCNNTSQLLEEDQNEETTEAPTNITPVQDLTNCSKVVLPTNAEKNTSLDIEKELITVYWLDQISGENVGVMYKYTDQNCSESAKVMTAHLFDDQKK